MGASKKILIRTTSGTGASEEVLATNALEVESADSPATGDVPARQADGTIKFEPQASVSGVQLTEEKNQANGYAGLDANAKINSSQIPDIALSEFLGNFTDTTAALADAGVQASQIGDWFTVNSNGGESWIVTTSEPTTLSDLTLLKTPTSDVSSVFSRTGAVTAQDGDYDASQIDNDSDVPGANVDDALNELNVECIGGMIAEAEDKTYILDQSARHAYSVENIYIKTSSGSCTAKLQINTTDITGISSVSVTSTEANASATAANSVSVGDTLKLVISSNSSAVDVGFSIETNRG